MFGTAAKIEAIAAGIHQGQQSSVEFELTKQQDVGPTFTFTSPGEPKIDVMLTFR